MKAIDIYYSHQAAARGIENASAAQAFAPMIDRIYDALILPHLPQNRQADIYELACGPGMVLAWLQRRGFVNARGTDFCEPYVKVARECGLKAEVKDSIVDLKSHPDESLDVVLAIDFIEHLPKDIFIEFLYESKRVLRSRGVLVLRAPNGDSPLVGRNLYNDITHFWAYTSIALRAITGIVGYSTITFADEAASPPPPHLRWTQPFAWIARKILRLTWVLATRERINYWGPNLFVIARR